MPYYDPRIVPAHGGAAANVYLVNEAPGPSEAEALIPLFGQQGANLYHSLRKARISWALAEMEFCWPIKSLDNANLSYLKRTCSKRGFLDLRSEHIKCTNAFPQWPKTDEHSTDFVDPNKVDVLSPSNLNRLKGEIPKRHTVLLVCGEFAYLACSGKQIVEPSTRERTALTADELKCINERLGSSFMCGWYMGHTRRWSLNVEKTSAVLKQVAGVVHWAIERAD